MEAADRSSDQALLLSKQQRLTKWWLISFYLAFVVATLLDHLMPKPNDESLLDISGALAQIESNFITNPITELLIVPRDCPTQYYEKVVFYRWPGTDQGCLCGGELRAERCDDSNSASCLDVHSTSRSNFTSWRGFTFCVKRERAYSLSLRNCKSGEKRCSPNYCVSGNRCPISSLILTNERPRDSDSEFQTISENQHLLIKRDENSNSIIDLKASINEPPCLTDARRPKRKQRSVSTLMRVSENGCGKMSLGQTSSMQTLDKLDESAFLTQNNRLDILQVFPELVDPLKSNEYLLVALRKFAIRKNQLSCENIDPQVLGGLQTLIDGVLQTGGFATLLVFFYVFSPLLFLAKSRWSLSVTAASYGGTILIVNCVFSALLGICHFTLRSHEASIKAMMEDYRWIDKMQCFEEDPINELFRVILTYDEDGSIYNETGQLSWKILSSTLFIVLYFSYRGLTKLLDVAQARNKDL